MDVSREPTQCATVEEVWVDPFRCRMWSLHDRMEEYLNEETCRGEIQSFLKHGQLVPVLGRRLRSDPRHDVELIYGARRLFVARHVNRPLRVQLRDLSDREALIAMHIENRHRQDISPYERGMSYASWLRGGQFHSQDEIARALQVSRSQVSRLLRIAKLPSVVVAAFGNPVEICEGWGLDIADALEDPARRSVVVRRARDIASMQPRPAPKEVFERLLCAGNRTLRAAKVGRDEVVQGPAGQTLFRVKRRLRDVALVLPLAAASPPVLAQVKRAVAEILGANVRYAPKRLSAVERCGSKAKLDRPLAAVDSAAAATGEVAA